MPLIPDTLNFRDFSYPSTKSIQSDITLLSISLFLYPLTVINPTLIFTLKLTICLMFLIVIRGCVPRYRYDFLTKMGWVKFLGYVLSLFLVSVSLFLLW
jgi:NADH:ubiquinone oxidoreductase subunit H